MFKRWCCGVLLGVSLVAIAGCGSSSETNSAGSDGEPNVEFWTMQLQPKFTEYFNTLISEFETGQSDLSVRWVDVPWSAMESKILTAVSAKTAPDVVNLNPNFASQLASRNAWLNLDTVLTQEMRDRYLPKIWEANQIEGQTFGIPWYLTTRISFYNQDLLEQAGIAEAPKTYEELAAVAAEVKAKTDKYAFFATFVPGDSNEVLESMVQMGVTFIGEDGKAAFNTSEGIAAFQYWVDLYEQKLLPPEVLTQGHQHAIELYQAGETAIVNTSPEFIKSIQQNAPSIAEVSIPSDQITGSTGKKNVAVMNLVIPKDSPDQEEALEFALFVTNTENQLEFAKSANVLPSTVDAVDQYIASLEEESAEDLLSLARQVSAQQLGDAEILIPAQKNLTQLQKFIYENLQAAMLGQKSVEQAVEDAAAAWDSLPQ
ncbi:carbohydrate ABC transporter substrate-binding protein, CUT1 family [[Leptolyngbya] sp. PCC 7376]|uniref:ABC transporter substrate-binding protein n=1 Tax=[Leptolyngbya] sp. PCC 7376 TaxID=111781 RepID=UPI00029EDF19|nr:sugar ABC transporter substrate-binding protein [[Leptolyngbya] sp. PCC 7376]AFY40062.1 carbohydrate ABC transporter substrate-binding protein, CUT1 family [[Leptolyngbya] sp. PCC 7376]